MIPLKKWPSFLPNKINIILLTWLASYSALCYASNTFAQDLKHYDWLSLIFAMAAGLLGGAARTIYTLVSTQVIVGNVRILLMKDLVVATIGGAAVFLAIEAWNTIVTTLTIVNLPLIQRDLRVLIIVGAGFSRGRWFGTLDKFATDAIENARTKLRGGPPPVDPAAVSSEPTNPNGS